MIEWTIIRKPRIPVRQKQPRSVDAEIIRKQLYSSSSVSTIRPYFHAMMLPFYGE